MKQISDSVMRIEAELQAPIAVAQLVHFDFAEPIDNLSPANDNYRLDLCLTPRPDNARACYTNRWRQWRFERLGHLFLTPAGEPMRARSDGCCEQDSLVCYLKSGQMQEWFDGDLRWTDRQLEGALDIRDTNIKNLLLRLAQEAKQPGFASDMLVELIAAQMAIELTRYCTEVADTPRSGGLAAWRLRMIDDRLRELTAPPTLVELAELCRLSVRQLTRGFRASRGCSIGDYVASSRVEHAKQLLAGEHSVKYIAYTLGFASPSSFCYAFRRATGESPGQYRQRLQRIH
jgi:AraC family transcriptional regulator